MEQITSFVPGRPRIARILGLGLPIVAGMSTQIAMGLVDMAFVGVLGTPALAAVGLCTFIAYVYQAMFWGMSNAVQAMAARRKGEDREGDTGRVLNTALLTVLMIAPPVSLLLALAAPLLLPLMNGDPEVVLLATPYLQWLFIGTIFLGMNQCFSGFWNAIDRSRLYMRVVIVINLANVLFNYVFIFGAFGVPAFGVTGAGIGTALASLLGTLFHFYLGWRHARPLGFLRVAPTREDFLGLRRLAVPGAIQQILDGLALALMFRIVGFIGTVELAAYSVLVNLINLVGMPGWGLGTAGATLVGQALGRKDVDDAARWAWDVIKVGVAGMGVMGAPMWLWPQGVLSLFIHEAETLDAALWPTRILGVMIMFNGIGYLLSAMLNGAGDVKRVMMVNLWTQYLILLPAAWLAGPVLGFGLLGIWLVHQVLFRAGQSVIFVLLWRRRRWARIRV